MEKANLVSDTLTDYEIDVLWKKLQKELKDSVHLTHHHFFATTRKNWRHLKIYCIPPNSYSTCLTLANYHFGEFAISIQWIGTDIHIRIKPSDW